MKKIPANILLFIKVYAIAITVFLLFRIILVVTQYERIGDSSIFDILNAFVMGVRFDVVVSSYIISVPFLLSAVSCLIRRNENLHKIATAISKYYLIVLFSLSFAVSAADVPYYNHFFARLSVAAFQWIDSPEFVVKMIFQEPRYWFIVVLLTILLFAFAKLVDKIVIAFNRNKCVINRYVMLSSSLLFIVLIFIGIRGRIEEKSPIRVGTAYFSNNPFLNQLGLNPNFTLIRSILDASKDENKIVSLINNNIAIANVQSYLNIECPNSQYPILRKIQYEAAETNRCNVILVIMESMSAAKMSRHGNKDGLTPFLDSISNYGYYFENAYTSGIHTMNGIFSTLFSYPALFRRHPMKGSSMLKYMGVYSTLRGNGYSTIYFTTHDGQFDNVEGFLIANDCERVVSKSDYPQEKVKTTLGVPDDYMFEYSIPILDELHERNKPFFATYMTASDHGPYYIPEYFTPINSEKRKKIVEYADYSLKKFIELSSPQKWFDNTVFVFIADHGSPVDNLYEMSIDYHHTPLLFYSPALITEPQVFHKIASQIDVFPSIMGILKMPYYNNTLGIDLFAENREYAMINAFDNYGVISENWFMIVGSDGSRKLYKYRDKDKCDYSVENNDVVEQMDMYLRSNIQVYQYIKNNNKQVAPEVYVP